MMKNFQFLGLFSLLLCLGAWTLPVGAQEPQLDVTADAKLQGELLGYWTVDEETLLKQFIARNKKAIERDGTIRQDLSLLAKMRSYLMVQHYSKGGVSIMHTINGDNRFQYKIVASRVKDKELDVDIQSHKFGTEKGTLIFHDGLMTLSSRGRANGAKVVMRRMSKEEAAKRIKRIRSIATSDDKKKAMAKLKAEWRREIKKPKAKLVWKNLDKPINQLKKELQGKNVLVFFHADWCVTCQLVKKHFQNPEVLQAIKANKVQLVSADLTANNDLLQAELKKQQGGGSVPFLLFINSKGEVISPSVVSYLKAAPLLKLIEKSFAAKE